MLAMLESTTEDSQNYLNVRDRKGKLLFGRAGDSLFERTLIYSFLPKTFLKFESFSPTIYVRECSGQKRRIVHPVVRRRGHSFTPTGDQQSPETGGCERHE